MNSRPPRYLLYPFVLFANYICCFAQIPVVDAEISSWNQSFLLGRSPGSPSSFWWSSQCVFTIDFWPSFSQHGHKIGEDLTQHIIYSWICWPCLVMNFHFLRMKSSTDVPRHQRSVRGPKLNPVAKKMRRSAGNMVDYTSSINQQDIGDLTSPKWWWNLTDLSLLNINKKWAQPWTGGILTGFALLKAFDKDISLAHIGQQFVDTWISPVEHFLVDFHVENHGI